MNSADVFKAIQRSDATLLIASTFGNGAAPKMGESFYKKLKDGNLENNELKAGFKFSVFGFGSTAYPKFCAFGKDLDKMLEERGGDRMYSLGFGDEEKNQRASFKTWVQQVFMFSLSALSVTASDVGMLEAFSTKSESTSEMMNEYKWAEYGDNYKRSLNRVLSTFHDRPIQDFTLKQKSKSSAC